MNIFPKKSNETSENVNLIFTASYFPKITFFTQYFLLRSLIDNGHNVNEETDKGISPLMMSAIRQDFDSARSLLQAGANLTSRDKFGRNALWMAVSFNRLPFVRFLLGKLI